jgi:hypothetical protein
MARPPSRAVQAARVGQVDRAEALGERLGQRHQEERDHSGEEEGEDGVEDGGLVHAFSRPAGPA